MAVRGWRGTWLRRWSTFAEFGTVLDPRVPRAAEERERDAERVCRGDSEVEEGDGEEDRQDLLDVCCGQMRSANVCSLEGRRRRTCDGHAQRAYFAVCGEADHIQTECDAAIDKQDEGEAQRDATASKHVVSVYAVDGTNRVQCSVAKGGREGFLRVEPWAQTR